MANTDYPSDWYTIRQRVLERDDGECQECGSTSALHVHHKDGDTSNSDMDNLITLCPTCHNPKHGNAEDTDREILRVLTEGRETRASLAEQVEIHPSYLSRRLLLLRRSELVRYHHEKTALFEITEKGEEWIEEA